MRSKSPLSARMFPFSPRDLLVTICILLCAAGVCILLRAADTSDGFASPIFVLAVLLTSRLTTGYLFGLIAAVLGVICVNFIFTYPYWAFNLTISGYPLTFLSFLAVSVITSTLTTQIKRQEQLRMENEKEKMRANLLRSVSHDIRHTRTASGNDEIAQKGTCTVGEMTIDHNKHQGLIRVANVKLTLSEFRIVALLGKHAGKALTYDFIIKEL